MNKDKRQSNRERMPNVAEIVDQIEEFFGKPKVLWCKEGDIELGKRDEWDAKPRKDQERGGG